MFNFFKRLFGLKGTWKWAFKQMKQGKIVYKNGYSRRRYRSGPTGDNILCRNFNTTRYRSIQFHPQDLKHVHWEIYDKEKRMMDNGRFRTV